MSLLPKKPLHVGIMLIISFVVLVAVLYLTFKEPPAPDVRPTTAVFVDEATGEFSKQDAKSLPPLKSPSGGTLVGVVLANPSQPPSLENSKYYFRVTADAKQLLDSMLASNPDTDVAAVLASKGQGKEVRLPKNGSPWLPANSPEGLAIQQ